MVYVAMHWRGHRGRDGRARALRRRRRRRPRTSSAAAVDGRGRGGGRGPSRWCSTPGSGSPSRARTTGPCSRTWTRCCAGPAGAGRCLAQAVPRPPARRSRRSRRRRVERDARHGRGHRAGRGRRRVVRAGARGGRLGRRRAGRDAWRRAGAPRRRSGQEAAVADGGMDRIRLTGIRRPGTTACSTHERRDGQTFVADVVLHLDTRGRRPTDRLDLTVDYGALAATVVAVLAGRAGRPARDRRRAHRRGRARRPSVAAVDVVVHKPQAPVAVPFADVAVEVHRRASTCRRSGPGARGADLRRPRTSSYPPWRPRWHPPWRRCRCRTRPPNAPRTSRPVEPVPPVAPVPVAPVPVAQPVMVPVSGSAGGPGVGAGAGPAGGRRRAGARPRARPPPPAGDALDVVPDAPGRRRPGARLEPRLEPGRCCGARSRDSTRSRASRSPPSRRWRGPRRSAGPTSRTTSTPCVLGRTTLARARCCTRARGSRRGTAGSGTSGGARGPWTSTSSCTARRSRSPTTSSCRTRARTSAPSCSSPGRRWTRAPCCPGSAAARWPRSPSGPRPGRHPLARAGLVGARGARP